VLFVAGFSFSKVHTIRLVSKTAIQQEIDAFLIDRQARGLSKRTVAWYGEQLNPFAQHLASQGLTDVEAITPDLLRRYFVDLSQTHNEGGVHGRYRAIRAFLNWWTTETEPLNWRNPISKVSAPKVPERLLKPVNLDDLQAMLGTCQRRTFAGDRDKALLMFLLDTGCRRAEVCALTLADVDLHDGSVLVRHGKGNKFRTVFVGSKTRRGLVAYLRHRTDLAPSAPLWCYKDGRPLTFWGLLGILRRRAKKAGVSTPTPHSFRRGFALACLRNGVDIYALQRMMGHSDLTMLRRYLAQTESDLRKAHEKGGPVDHLLGGK